MIHMLGCKSRDEGSIPSRDSNNEDMVVKINIIGDIAGRYDELIKLLAKMPEADLVLSVGDMVDRGKDSKKVIEFFMTHPHAEAIYGNHEDMMVEGIKKGNSRDWLYNGGHATLESYKDASGKPVVPPEHIAWLEKRPMYFQTDDLFVSHAPVTSLKNVPKDPYGRDYFFVWNRYEPSKPQKKYMIHGHNGRFRLYKWGDSTEYGMCIDNSHKGELTGVHWPTKEIFTQKFTEVEEFEALPAEEKLRLQIEAEKKQKEYDDALRLLAGFI